MPLLPSAESVESLRKELEELGSEIADTIQSQYPQALIGYLWTCMLLSLMERSNEDSGTIPSVSHDEDEILLALEYVHAVLCSFGSRVSDFQQVDETQANHLLSLCKSVREKALQFALASSRKNRHSFFGIQDGEIEFRILSTWLLIRGNRYQVLEEEFFAFTLMPHSDFLQDIYGADAAAIAAGIQEIAFSMRSGHQRALEGIENHRAASVEAARAEGLSFEEYMQRFSKDNSEKACELQDHLRALFFGGICNISKNTSLPTALLQDVSFKLRSNNDFYAPGAFCGTPYRTLPARIRPFVELDDGFYAVEPNFARDSCYRAIQRAIISARPDYKEVWNKRQKELTESSFQTIFSEFLGNCKVYNEIFYKTQDGNWSETDCLLIIDDVLLCIEVKAGIGTLQSPGTNIESHMRAIENLILKGYRQAKRFIEYLYSNPTVNLFKLESGRYAKIDTISSGHFRRIIPIGLTVESFAPYSTMSKNLPEVQPICRLWNFISMSIEDFLVFRHIFPTLGEFVHYLCVRQGVAGIKEAQLFDEMDHLGAYFAKNRFDEVIKQQVDKKRLTMITWDGFDQDVIGPYFMHPDYPDCDPPKQSYPSEMLDIFRVLEATRGSGWLEADNLLRDLGSDARGKFAECVKRILPTLAHISTTWFCMAGEPPLLVWLTRAYATSLDSGAIRKAEAFTLAADAPFSFVIQLGVDMEGQFVTASAKRISRPPIVRMDFQTLEDEARSMRRNIVKSKLEKGPRRKKSRT